MISTGAEGRRCGYPNTVTEISGRVDRHAFGDRCPHTQDPIHLAALLNQEHWRREVAMHHRGGLDLDALRGVDRPAHFPANDRLAGLDVPFDEAAFRDQYLAANAEVAADGA